MNWPRPLDDASRPLPLQDLFFDTPQVWQAPLAVGLILVLWFLLFVLVGGAVARLEPNGDTKARGIRRYRAVIWGGVAFFVFSVPASLFLTWSLAFFFGYALMVTANAPFLFLAPLSAALVSTWCVLRSLFVATPLAPRGPELSEAAQPGLFALLREVEKVTGTRPVDRVELLPGPEIGVYEQGSAFDVLFGHGRRVLVLGYSTLRDLAEEELKAILAHEYGHLSHGETRLGPTIRHVQAATTMIYLRLQQSGWRGQINPVFWYLEGWLRAFGRVTLAHTRRSELLADDTAVRAYGSRSFREGLKKSEWASDFFGKFCVPFVASLRGVGGRCTDFYRCLSAAEAARDSTLRDESLARLLERPSREQDTHPSFRERITRAGLAGVTDQMPARPKIRLLDDETALRRTLTAWIVREVESDLQRGGALLPEVRELAEEQQARFAEAIALQLDAVTYAERGDAKAAFLFAAFVDYSTEVLGLEDPFIVRALHGLARIRELLGRTAEARVALQQALDIAVAQPQRDLGGEARLRQHLEALQRQPEQPVRRQDTV